MSVLNPAVPPLAPTGPKVMMNTVLSIFLATLLGVGFSIIAEMLDRRVRSEEDLAGLLQIPVFGAIAWTPPKRTRLGKMTSFLPRSLRIN